jgi:hypothetical protein
MLRHSLLATLALALLTTAAFAGPNDYWLHVRVDEHGSDGEQVRINLPIQLVESVLPLIHDKGAQGGHLSIDMANHDIDLPKVLAAVRDARDGEYITVTSEDENVRVAKQAGYLLVKAIDADETVDIRIRLSVVDALLTPADNPEEIDKGELNLVAAVRALAEQGEGDIVTVTGDDENVRIWIDGKETAE